MSDFVAPAGYATVVWWFTTGAILILDGLPPRTFRWSMGAATGILLAAAYVLRASCQDQSVGGAYVGFTCALLIWGWLEMSFLMGFITGPRRRPCLDRCSGWRHFMHATQAIIYNEIATVVGAALIMGATWQAANRMALWTYLILWAMRVSAKLNVFLGVPNLGESFLPAHLQYLKSFFRKRPMNFLFPVSISASTIAVFVLLQHYSAASTPFHGACYAFSATLCALAVLEHWFMVLPFPSEWLWRWAMRHDRDSESHPDLGARLTAKAP